MPATILDDKATATAIKEELKSRVARLREQGIAPGLGTVLVGDDPGSRSYVAGKHRDCEQVGITSIRRDLPTSATQAEVETAIAELNADPACTGYIVQLPSVVRRMASSVTPRGTCGTWRRTSPRCLAGWAR